eukprot:TRINITY_DN9035_c0_g2_i2.p1 TRINITY_DN9035_c0_g2~~TRINITY_DN9035_c0_g2_i2.p1  ORF type:complete len:274 (+),score=57.68 TRINITY_DN9035_c0_g2_i2:124-945(+)
MILREWRAKTKGSVGFVPTMGYLHDGHLSLVDQSKKACDNTVVSIFVNRTQFAPHEDFDRYPRDIERDCKLLQTVKPDVVFAPEPSEMYPAGYKTFVEVHDLQHKQEGVFRPTFFRGVATVLVKFFNIVGAQKAFFGQKDAQQCIVVRKFVKDLDIPLDVVICPTKREHDGLAMSSRNVYLSSEERPRATAIYQGLDRANVAFKSGERDAKTLQRLVQDRIAAEPLFTLDYVQLADPTTLEDVSDKTSESVLVTVAARIGRTRLIDNMIFPQP